MPEEPEGRSPAAEVPALAELALCENLAQISSVVARWSARLSGAEAALLWAPDAGSPLFLCVGVYGEGTRPLLRRSAARDTGGLPELLRDRQARALERPEFASDESSWLRGLPDSMRTCLAIPLEAEGGVVGLLALLFAERPQTQPTLRRLDGFLRPSTAALSRSLRTERKTVGMLHAIERLTNLYDLSKAFGSTIDLPELNQLIVSKAVDFVSAEMGSLWLLEGDEVALGATAVNENYDVENAPEAVGASIVGDLVAEASALRRNHLDPGDPLASEDAQHEVGSVLAVPMLEDESPIGALVLVNKRGRHPEFSSEDEELLSDLARQAVRALRNARQHEAERKVEELDALLTVSREITATLDLDRVMQTIVNASAALISYDRCAIGILDRGRLRLGAVSGVVEIDRKQDDIRRTEEILQWVFLSGADVNVTQREDGTLGAERTETEEKFQAFFRESNLKAFYAAILKDEEGKLGVLAFECREPIVFDEETRDLLQILVNQATVAVRNAQLYQQVPLAGFLQPLSKKGRRLLDVPRRRRMAWGIGALAATILLFAVPWRLRIAGPARVLPGRRAVVTARVDGIVTSVLHREGDVVSAGEILATQDSESYAASLADAQAAYRIAQSDVAKYQDAGDAGAMFDARSRSDDRKARLAVEQGRFDDTRLRSPVAGVIVTPRLEERIGQNLSPGAEFCVVADVKTVTVEIGIPEEDASLIRDGEAVDIKLNPYPGRTYRCEVTRVGARIREDGKERFVIAEARLQNPDGAIKTGMVGMGKVRAGSRSIAILLLRKPARWLYAKLWPILP